VAKMQSPLEVYSYNISATVSLLYDYEI